VFRLAEIISTGIAKISYATGGDGLISFKINSPIRVLSKSAGSNMQLWGVDINGRRGYANKDFIMEKKVLIRDKDLKFEVPVLGPGSPPVESVETPLQPVLNASESSDDLATTTTSPLDVTVDSIVVEQDKLKDQQVPDPTASSKAPVQLVEGTVLPLEVLPAVTETTIVPEKTEEPLEVTKSESASAAVDTKEPQASTSESSKPQEVSTEELPAVEAQKPSPLLQAINAELEDTEDFDYGDDEAGEDDNDDDDDFKQGTEDNKSITEKANDKKSINDSIEVNPLSVEQKNATDQLEGAKKEAEAKQVEVEVPAKEEVKPLVPTNSESPLPTESLNEATTEKQTEVKEAPKAEQDAVVESKPLDPVSVGYITEKVTETPLPNVKDDVKEETATLSAEIQAEPAKDNTADPVVAQSEEGAQSESVTSSTVPAIEEATPKAEPVGLPPLFEKKNFENPNDYYKQLQEQQQKQKLIAEAELQKKLQEDEEQQKKLQEEADQQKRLLEEAEQQKRLQEEAEQQKRLQEEAEQLKRLQEEAEQQKRFQEEEEEQRRLQELAEQQQRSSEEAEQQLRVQEDDLQQLNDSVDTQSNEVFDNPNDYYKDQQTEQHHHHQHHHNPTESAYNNPSSAEQTTPTPDAESPYGAVHEESTQASPTDYERAGVGSVEPVALPATSSPASEVPVKEDGVGGGLFATIVDTVNNFIGKEPQAGPSDNSDELQRILYPGIAEVASSQKKPEGELVIMSTLFPVSK